MHGVTAFFIRTGRPAPTTAPASRASSSIRRSPGCWAQRSASSFPGMSSPIALTFLTLAATGLATRALALEALDDLPATLAGCASLFSFFTLFTAYERSAFPEFAGGFWLPLIVLFVMRDRPNSGKPQISMDGVPRSLAFGDRGGKRDLPRNSRDPSSAVLSTVPPRRWPSPSPARGSPTFPSA